MKQIELWNRGIYDNKELLTIVPVEKISEVVDCTNDSTYIIRGINSGLAGELTEKYQKDLNNEKACNINNSDDLIDWFAFHGYGDLDIICLDTPEIEDVLAFTGNEFHNLNDCETFKQYKYWDGSNWKLLWNTEGSSILTISNNSVTLDEWDGNNFITGGIGGHLDVHRIIEIDEEKQDNLYLFYYYSQWQGSLSVGEIVTENELKSKISGIEDRFERDIDNYIEKIQSL